MIPNPTSWQALLLNLKDFARRALPANQKLMARLKRERPDDLDDVAGTLHNQAFEEIDCKQCANCCKTTSPRITNRDVDRLAHHLRLKPSQLIEKYLRLDTDGTYVLTQTPCPFLDTDDTCTVYDHRPAACREYPHTDRSRFYQILDLTVKNTYICPAAYRVVQGLHAHYPEIQGKK